MAQGNSDTAAAEIQDALTDVVVGVSTLATAIPINRSSFTVGATAAGAISSKPYKGNPPPGVTQLSHLSLDDAAEPSTPSNSSHSSVREAIRTSSSHSDESDRWQPPKYRREALRIRSKREVQTAQHAQGRNLVVEDLQKLLRSSSKGFSATNNAPSDTPEQVDAHLEAFIEQVLCPKLNAWELKRSAPAAPDGSKAVPPEVLQSIGTVSADELAQLQANLARNGQFSAALLILEEAVAAGRLDVVAQTSHRAFLRSAGAAGNTRAVLRFLQLLPADYATAQTYNLALKACSTAKDLPGALKVVDMMAIRQVPCDFIHFTTLIAGELIVLFMEMEASLPVKQYLLQFLSRYCQTNVVRLQVREVHHLLQYTWLHTSPQQLPYKGSANT